MEKEASCFSWLGFYMMMDYREPLYSPLKLLYRAARKTSS